MVRRTNLFFLEAFIIAVIVFGLGIFLGMAIESSYSKKIEKNYLNSEIYLLDALALNEFVGLNNQSCPDLIKSNLIFADRIYDEAKTLENFEEAEKLKDTLTFIHKRYDLLRTFLWLSSMKVREKCPTDLSVVVYVYEYQTKDLAKLARQDLWEITLGDLKKELGDKLLLIPIAGNSRITTLDVLLKQKGINSSEDLPVVIINEKSVVRELPPTEQLKELIEKR